MQTRTPWGLREAARQAMINIVPRGGRYLFNGEEELAEIFAKQEGLSAESVIPFAGSSEPLHYTVLASPAKTGRWWSPIPATKRRCGQPK